MSKISIFPLVSNTLDFVSDYLSPTLCINHTQYKALIDLNNKCCNFYAFYVVDTFDNGIFLQTFAFQMSFFQMNIFLLFLLFDRQ